MQRYRDWPQRLSAYLRETSRTPFVSVDSYGERDCALFAAGAVQALTGEDLTAEYRPPGSNRPYTTYHEGLALTGFKRLSKFVDHLLPRTTRAKAQRGDIAWVVERTPPDNHLRGCLMVVDGSTLAALGGERRPLSAGRRFWRVG